MKVRKIPMRMCVVTREKFPKNELIRVVKTPEDKVIIDESGKANGRGAYLKKEKEVFLKAKESKILNKQLEIEVPSEIFDELDNLLD